MRRTLAVLATATALLLAGAPAAQARPGEPGDRGINSAMFAGAKAKGCVPYGVFNLNACK